MKLFLIDTGHTGEDTYDRILVVAKNRVDADRWYTTTFVPHRIREAERSSYLEDYQIEEIDLDAYSEATELLSSFHAG